ncbi:GntR family transcriptional regulator [Sphingopyxis sp.]|uniref:GntR family transcriptional regulator n=1 Tax=Sphingopyxis sp. TaxID=1908224 RepID=UPI002D778F4A|nr:GntR family transcriptional regulator [Sphingopyxis sp.]HET6523521.1 GntR family transcriptional regulator [Sphingopyxis sp.]
MSPAHVLEPTYEAIKLRLKIGKWPAGLRLEAAKLADELGVSITPVRDSLWRLAGEHMVDVTPGEGFRVPRLGQDELRDLLELNCILLLAAMSVVPAARDRRTEIGGNVAERTARLFLDIAGRAGNGALLATVSAINDRLHLMRLQEGAVMPESDGELATLERAIDEREADGRVRDLLLRYHHSRGQAADRMTRLLAPGE